MVDIRPPRLGIRGQGKKMSTTTMSYKITGVGNECDGSPRFETPAEAARDFLDNIQDVFPHVAAGYSYDVDITDDMPAALAEDLMIEGMAQILGPDYGFEDTCGNWHSAKNQWGYSIVTV